MPTVLESETMDDYLASSEVIDSHHPEVAALAEQLAQGARSDVERAERLYRWVRDEIPHSHDVRHETVTCRASEVLRHRTGICFAKAHLLAAMLRRVAIPAGFCYQMLRYDGKPSDRMILHGLNGIYLASIGRWIRVDCRGNKPGVDAQFRLDREQLAFPVHAEMGESLHPMIFARPLPGIVHCLTAFATVTDVFANLPGSIE